jgi:hypothetical protein
MARMECFSTEITYNDESRLFTISQDSDSMGDHNIYVTYDQIKWILEESNRILESE